MPKIREYSQQVRIAGPSQGGYIDAREFSTAAGLNAIGQSLSGAEDAVTTHLENKQKFDVQLAAAKDESEFNVEFQQASEKAIQDGDETFLPKMQERIAERKTKFLEDNNGFFNSGNQHAAMAVEQNYGRYANRLVDMQSTIVATNAKNGLTEVKTLDENTVYNNPAQLEATIEKQKALAVQGEQAYGKVFGDKYSKEVVESLTGKALDGTVTGLVKNRNTTVGQIDAMVAAMEAKDSKWLKANPGKFDEQKSKLLAFREQKKNEGRGLEVYKFQVAMKQISETGRDDRGILKVYTPERIAALSDSPETTLKLLDMREVAIASGEAKNEIAVSGFADFSKKLSTISSKEYLGSSANYTVDSAKAKAYAEVGENFVKQFKEDSASTIQSASPGVAALWGRVQEEIQKDQPNATVIDDYVATFERESARIAGAPNASFVPKSYSGQMKAVLSSVDNTPEGADRAARELRKFADTWGNNTGKAASAMLANKDLNPSQYVVLTMSDQPESVATQKEILRASVIPDEELKKAAPGLKVEKVRQQVQDKLKPLFKTLEADADSVAQRDAFVESITKTVMARGGFEEVNTANAIDELTKKAVLDKYEFKKTYRVPKVLNGAPIPANAVEFGGRSVLEDIQGGKFNLVLPSNSSLTKEQIDERYRRSVSSSGYLVNNGDAGVTVADQNGQTVLHVNEKGKLAPLQFTWDELAGYGHDAKQKAFQFKKTLAPTEREKKAIDSQMREEAAQNRINERNGAPPKPKSYDRFKLL